MSHPYAINAKVYNSLIVLCADICKRNGIKSLKWRGDKSLIGQVDKQNMTVHRWFANKACPGDYIYERLGQIADAVNEKLGSSSSSSTSKPSTSQDESWSATGTATCGGNGVRVRSTPTASTSSNILGKLYKNNRFEIDGNDVAGWTHIKVHLGGKDVIGYISSQYVKKD